MITTEERKVFGWLGKIPDCVLKGSMQEAIEYKAIAEEADQVAKMRASETKEARAKQVERKYYQLIDKIEGRLDGIGIPYKKADRPQA